MLLAGAAPIDPVRLQLVLLYVLLGSVAIAALMTVLLASCASSVSRRRDGPTAMRA